LIITCPECETRYRYDESRFGDDLVKQVKCTSCGHAFEAANPAMNVAASGKPQDEVEGFEPDVDSGDDLHLDIADVPAPAPPVAAEETPTSEEDSAIPPLPTDPRYSLAVIAGGQAGTVFQIHKPRILLGRGSAMDIQLRDSEVSRRHAALEIRDPEVTLTDLKTTNGTWFNGAKIQETRLGHQDEFTLGSTTLMLIVTPVRDAH
jgi:predicted Zn finger-like uncharacterized protein